MLTPDGAFRDEESTAVANGLTPDSIQEALRMYLQPIKNEDPKLDFYTMYKRETVEYDTEYMQKHNEDLNTTLIFVSSLAASYSLILPRSSPLSEFEAGLQPSPRHNDKIPNPYKSRAESESM
jgi:hypothetical protein